MTHDRPRSANTFASGMTVAVRAHGLVRSLMLAVALVVAAPHATPAQVFIAATPHPEFAIGPLFISASVTPALEPVNVNVSFSLALRPNRTAADVAGDLYLLWPAEVAESTAPGAADPALVGYIEQRGLTIVRSGRLVLRSRDRLELGSGSIGQPAGASVSYVTFMRGGATGAQLGVGSYVKIPWTPKLADPLTVMTLVLPLHGLITAKPASWPEQVFFGPRSMLTVGYGDFGSVAVPLYPLYFEQRDHVVPLARDYSVVLVNFADADHLNIDDVAPRTATRRRSSVRSGNEIVSMVLSPLQGIVPQTVKIEFIYYRGRIAWRPIVVTALLLLASNVAGVIMFGREVTRLVRDVRARRVHRAAARAAAAALPTREALGTLPLRATYDQVVERFGAPTDEHERVNPPGRRSLVYRAGRDDGRGTESAEVEIVLDDDGVEEIHYRVRRGPGSSA